MKVVSWNINGIRTLKNAMKKTLDSLEADIICFQETKVTRDALDEGTANVEGYNSYFSFCKRRGGYAGVATFCKDSSTPFAAEEGLTGLMTKNEGAVGCYGDLEELSDEELQSLDNEGRAVITQHKISVSETTKVLTVVNVYCPRADPDKPERKIFQLNFYKLLQSRVETLLASGSHVIVLGDINTFHQPIDHCDPDGIDSFEDNPGRRWLNNFLFVTTKEEHEVNLAMEGLDSFPELPTLSKGKFVDTFRFLHPSRVQAFTCWSTRTRARQTNYGTRIDYIFADCALARSLLESTDIMPEMEGSDHCPIWACLTCRVIPNTQCPSLCTRHMPEFAGRQQKLSHFFVKPVDKAACVDSCHSTPSSSQETGDIGEKLSQDRCKLVATGKKRKLEKVADTSKKKNKMTNGAPNNPQGSLLAFFKPLAQSHKDFTCTEYTSNDSGGVTEKTHDSGNGATGHLAKGQLERNAITLLHLNFHSPKDVSDVKKAPAVKGHQQQRKPDEGSSTPSDESGGTTHCASHSFWKAILRGPLQPPLCKAHGEPCVLRTVKKGGANMGRQFFVCARPQGHASNLQARCNYFEWVDIRK